MFHRLANDAEEEENKEAVPAYYFLLSSEQSRNREDLDKKIERWLADRWQCRVDFEINNALIKLLALKLMNEADGRLGVVPIRQGMKNLDQCWDAYYRS